MQQGVLPFIEVAPTVLTTIESAGLINALEAQSMGFSGKGVKVAILDTGIQSDHPAIAGHVIKKVPLAAGNIEDGNGHGTHVASIVLSVAPDAQLLNIKVLDDAGGGSLDTVMKGIEIAADEGAHIISMSLGVYAGCYKDHPICLLINRINHDRKIMFCAAAGNAGPYTSPAVPSLAAGCVSVGATDQYDKVANFSSRGPCMGAFPDCVAPGVGINAAYPVNQFKSLSGTSMANPHMAGMLAILRQKSRRGLLKEEVDEILKNSAKRLDTIKNDDSGWGRIDVMKALSAAETVAPPTVTMGLSLPWTLTLVGSAFIMLSEKI